MRTSGALVPFLLLTLSSPALAIPGATDRIAAASLLVPFFETGIDPEVNPHDTLLSVNSRTGSERTFHYHVWDIDGNPTTLRGNVILPAFGSWSAAMRDLLNSGPAAARTALTEGAFYRGFITIDGVTASTNLNPRQGGFPFSNSNVLEGYIYYTRLSQGSANGLAMVPLEALPGTADVFVRGFYTGFDDREEIDTSARRCAHNLASGDACGALDSDIDHLNLRVFRSAPLSGQTRAIVFTWLLGQTGGLSTYCDVPANSCASTYDFRQLNEAGVVLQDGTLRFDHVVNIIPNSFLVGTESGFFRIINIPDPIEDVQIYGFAFNSANPAGDPNLTWDAIFEAFIDP